MMRLLPLTPLLLLLLLLSAQGAHACSKGTFPVRLGGSQAFFTGTATSETVLAGPGSVQFGSGDDQDGRAPDRPIHGQVIRVDQIGGAEAGRLPVDVREVVVVPWGYNSACRTLPWSGSAQWVPPGTNGFFVAQLRDPEHWVGARPTFDLHNPYNQPYTGTSRVQDVMMRDTSVASLLAPRQVFDLFQAMPTVGELQREGEAALKPLRAWVSNHPDLARRPPAEALLMQVLHILSNAELKKADHPVLGTWRFTLHVPGDTSFIVYARTRSRPTTRWTPSRPQPEPDPAELRLLPAQGYAMVMDVAAALEDLPETEADYGRLAQSYLYSSARPNSAEGDTTSWRGWIEPSLLQRSFPDHPRVQQAVKYARERFPGTARFVRGADGVLRVRQVFPGDGAEALVLEGEQISRQVVQAEPALMEAVLIVNDTAQAEQILRQGRRGSIRGPRVSASTASASPRYTGTAIEDPPC